MKFLYICFILSWSVLCADEGLDFAELVKQLGHNDFKIRVAAKNKLKENLFEAFPEILKAEKSEDLEVSSSVAELLSSVMNYRDPTFRGVPIRDVKLNYGDEKYKKHNIKFLNDLYESNYRDFDRKNPDWDGAIKELYTGMVIAFRDRKKWNKAATKKVIDSLEKKGCDSLIFFYLAGSFYFMDSMNDKCKGYFEKVIERDEEFKGNGMFFCMASVKLSEYFRSKGNSKSMEKYKAIHLNQLPKYLETLDFNDPLIVRYVAGLIVSSVFKDDEKVRCLEIVLSKVPKGGLFSLLLQGDIHSARAWSARGTDFIDKVTNSGLNTFREELKKAAVYYEQAYAKFPDSPIAPAKLISISTFADGASTKSSREWFDRTIAIECDYVPAYDNYYYVLDRRWGGSKEDQLAFVDELILVGSKYEDAADLFFNFAWNLTFSIIVKEYDWQQWLKNKENFKRFSYLYKKMSAKDPSNTQRQNVWAILLYGKGDIKQHLLVKEKISKTFKLQATSLRINEKEYLSIIEFHNKFRNEPIYKEYYEMSLEEKFVMTPKFRELYMKWIEEIGVSFLTYIPKKHLLYTYAGSDLILNDLWRAGYKEGLLIMLEHHLRRSREPDPKILDWYVSRFQKTELEAHAIFCHSNPYFGSTVFSVVENLEDYFKQELGDGYKENLLYKKAVLRAYLRFGFYGMSTSQIIKTIDGLVVGITDYGDIFDFSLSQYVYGVDSFEKAKFLWRLYVKVFAPVCFNFEKDAQLLAELDRLEVKELRAFWLKHGHIGIVDELYREISPKDTLLGGRILYLNYNFAGYYCEAMNFYPQDFRNLSMALGNTSSGLPRTLLMMEKALSYTKMPEISLLAASIALEQKKWDNVKKNLQSGLVRSKLKGPLYCDKKKFETQEDLLEYVKAKIQNHEEAPEELKEFAVTCVLKN